MTQRFFTSFGSALAVLCLAAMAGADTIVSTLTSTPDSAISVDIYDTTQHAAEFTTGPERYALTGVTAHLRWGADAGPIEAYLYSDAAGLPGEMLLHLPTFHHSGSGNRQVTFTPSSPFQLEADTTYHLVMHSPESPGGLGFSARWAVALGGTFTVTGGGTAEVGREVRHGTEPWQNQLGPTQGLLFAIEGTPIEASLPSPTVITYQGRLDVDGLPASGLADFQFTLWNSDLDGQSLGVPIVVNNVDVFEGLFTVELDFGTLLFDDAARWLEIAVRMPPGSGEFSTLDPRQLLTAAPFAVRTRGLHVTDDGKVGILNSTPASELDVAGTVTAVAFVGDGSQLTNLPSADPLWSENGSGIFYDAGRVGLGTSAPAAALHVTTPGGSANLLLSKDDSGFENNVVFDGSGTQYRFGTPTGDRLRVWSNSGGELLTLTPDGRLGLRATAPAEALHVRGGNVLADRGAFTAGQARSLTLGGARQSGGEDFARIDFRNFDNDSSATDYTGASIGSFNAGGADNGDLRFATATEAQLTERMRITPDGKVGIGTTAPVSELDVAGVVTADAFVGDGSGLTNLPGSGLWTEDGDDIHYAAGRVGIGTTTPSAALHVVGSMAVEGTLEVDQAQEEAQGTLYASTTWQSITAGMDGVLGSVDVMPSTQNTSPGGTLTIYEGHGVEGTVLLTQEYSIPAGSNGKWTNIPLSAPLHLKTGDVFTLHFLSSDGLHRLRGQLNNPYPGGWSNGSNGYDFTFRTYMRSEGDLRFGPKGDLHATADTAATILVRGKIGSDGRVFTGRSTAGVTAKLIESGHYRVTFPPQTFTHVPSVTVTAFNDTGENRYAVLDDSVSTTGFEVYIRNQGGTLHSASFNFIALGPR
jgi:hypothetical protein